MQMNDMILVSVDDHVIEPPHAFRNHLSFRYAPRAPFVEDVGGTDYWNFDGRRFMLAGLNAVAGRPREEYGIEPASYRQLRPGAYDLAARIDDMNANGVLGSLCFPSIMGFGGGLACELEDKGYALAVVQAYNDWHVHEWAAGAPGRIIPLCILPIWDMALAVAELRRLSALGVHAVSFPDNPAFDGRLPSIHNSAWDPVWQACADHDIALCLHIGTGAQPPHTTMDEPVDAWMTTIPMATCFPAADWLFAPMWKKFPNLRVILSEAGIGWIPYLLERADFVFDHHHAWTHSNFDGGRPSDVFRRHMTACFIDDRYGVMNRHVLGLDRITWECDYPHSDCTWPNSPEILWKSFDDVADADIDAITHLNAMREFRYDPIALLGRDKCTVGALRRAAAHVDTAPTSGLGGAAPGRGVQVTVGDMKAEMLKQMKGMAA